MWRSEVNYNNYLKIIDIRIKGREILMGIRRWLSGVIKSNESCGLAEGIWYRRRGRTTSSDRYYTRFSLFRGPIIIRCFTMLIDRRHNYAAELAALRMLDAQLMPRHRQIIGHRVFFSRLIPFLPVRPRSTPKTNWKHRSLRQSNQFHHIPPRAYLNRKLPNLSEILG